MAGAQLRAGKVAVEHVKGLDGTPEASVLGSNLKTSAEMAAFANGVFGHAVEYEDDIDPDRTGPFTVWPVVFSLAEKLNLPGRSIIEALVVGVEVQSRLGLACPGVRRRGFLTMNLFGNFGATAAAVKLLKLNVDQARVALGIAASSAGGLRYQAGDMAHYFETGSACRNGVMAAMLSKIGASAHNDVFEHPRGFCHTFAGEGGYSLEKLVEGFGTPFRVHEVAVKKYPCCFMNHRIIDGVLELVDQHNIASDDVESVEVEVNPAVPETLCYAEPTTGEQSRFSLQNSVAAALLGEKFGQETFTDAKVRDPKFKATRQKIKMIVHPDWEALPQSGVNPVTITLRDGRKYTKVCEFPRGAPPGPPLNRTEIETKYLDCVKPLLSNTHIAESLGLIWDLENLSDVNRLMHIAALEG